MEVSQQTSLSESKEENTSDSGKGLQFPSTWTVPHYPYSTMHEPLITAVIPARNEATRLPDTLFRLGRVAGNLGVALEIIVVDDGCDDSTVAVALANGCTVAHNGRGSGITSAFRKGARYASGEFVMLCPADVANFDFLSDFVHRRNEADIFSVSKRHPRSKVIGYSKFRWRVSNTYDRLVHLLFNISKGCSDTHYVKLYRRSLLKRILPDATVNGPAGETELIVRSLRGGYSLIEVPGEIRHLQMDSKTSIWLIIRTGADLVLLWSLIRIGYPHRDSSPYA